MTLARRVVERLERERIPHALIGAAALAIHGVSRATADLDILTVDTKVLDPRLRLFASAISTQYQRGDSPQITPAVSAVRLFVEEKGDGLSGA